MSEQPSPPPPPPPPTPVSARTQRTGFHGPETHFFIGVRVQLTFLERYLRSRLGKSPRNGLLVALLLGASLSTGLSVIFELALSSVGIAGYISIFPLFEEFFKGLSSFLVASLMWKSIPNRRYGALLGAASGLGFAIVENIIYSIGFAGAANATAGQIAESIIARWIGLPFMHVLWSAFIGTGLFVFVAQRKVRGSRFWLAIPFLLFGWAAHMCWNALALGLQAAGLNLIVVVILDVIIVFMPFAFIFRDFLGSHLNFQEFLAILRERPPTTSMIGPFTPPPPTPPPQLQP